MMRLATMFLLAGLTGQAIGCGSAEPTPPPEQVQNAPTTELPEQSPENTTTSSKRIN